MVAKQAFLKKLRFFRSLQLLQRKLLFISMAWVYRVKKEGSASL
jgi:hypothetical protein